MSVSVFHHDLMQSYRLLQIPTPLGNAFIKRNPIYAIFAVKLKDIVVFVLQNTIQQQQFKTRIIIMLFVT